MKRACLLIACFVSGCFNPDDIFPVEGRLISDGGVGGQRVELFRGEVPTWKGGCPSPRALKEFNAEADGTFTLDVFRAQAQRLGTAGLASVTGGEQPGGFCFQAKTRFESATEVVATFRNVNAEYQLPPLTDWIANVSPGAVFYRFELATPPAPSRPGGFAEAARVELVTEDGSLAWAHAVRSSFSPDGGLRSAFVTFTDEQLEDFTAALQPVMRFGYAGIIVSPGQHEDVTVDLRAGRPFPVQGDTIPFSRGLSCPPFADPCPLTDGKLDRVDGGSVPQVSLRWSLPRRLSMVLLRGVETGPASVTARSLGADGGTAARGNELWAANRWDIPVEFWPGDEFVPLEDQLGPDRTAVMMPRFVSMTLYSAQPSVGLDLTFPGGLAGITEVSIFE
jgi:hypothetical protein